MFLKFALCSDTPDKEFIGHNLGNLYEEYREKYPDDKYKLDIPLYHTEDSPVELAREIDSKVDSKADNE